MRRLTVLGAMSAATRVSRNASTSATLTVSSRVASSGQRKPMNPTNAITSWR